MDYLLDENGDKLVVCHGTNRKFKKHKMSKNRTQLNDNYQGDWVCYVKAESVAWKYSKAKRNSQVDKDDFLSETHSVFSKINNDVADFMVDFSKSMMEDGWESGWKNAIDKFASENKIQEDDASFKFFEKIRSYEKELNFDINDFCDCLEHVEYNKLLEDDVLDNVMSMFDNSNVSGLDSHTIKVLEDLGYDKIIPEERVLESYVKASKVLRTKSRKIAKAARNNGYDLVIYSGVDCVDNEPEYLIADPKQVETIAINRMIKLELEEDDSFYTVTTYEKKRDEIKQAEIKPTKKIIKQTKKRNSPRL